MVLKGRERLFLFFSGIKNKRPNIVTKDVPIAHIIQEIPKGIGMVSQELWMKSKYT